MREKHRKSQMWFTDFVVGTLIFTFMLIIYYTYTVNISKQDSLTARDLLLDVESVSSSLLLGGFPDNWNNGTVQSIGVTNSNQRLNRTKFLNFEELPYNKTKKLFGTVYDYFVFFTDEDSNITSVEGICGIGDPEINSSYDIRSAYYYDNPGDSFLKDFMVNSLDADVYSEESGYEDFDALVDNINNYGFVVIEHPMLQTSVFNDNKGEIENFAANGGLLMLSGEIVSAQGKEMVGVEFYKKSGQSESNRNATVVAEDEFLAFSVGENIIFRQAYYVENQAGAENFTEIVEFNEDGKAAVARWSYGNGGVFYFSDMDTDYFAGDFVDEVTDAILEWGNFRCNPITLGNIQYENLVKIERVVIYDSKPVKMVIYLWQ
ncbi:hypothetical protein HYU50_05105 [Candidatus Woesearchaeota archaeon]|nr:hypothetical protein [Candidatus Woesearchaeota archaeon]